MRKAALLLFLLVLSFAFSTAVVAQNNATSQPPQDLCQGMACGDSVLTCPDGYAAKCSNSCDSSTGKCSQCTPSCSGHDKSFCETTQCGSSELACPDGFKAACAKTCDNAARQCKDCTPSCAGHETPPTSNGTQPPSTACPAPPQQPACAAGEYVYTNYDSKGCVANYECRKTATSQPATSCPAPPPAPQCPSGQYLSNKYDSSGCVTGYECKSSSTTTCPAPPPAPTCGQGEYLYHKYDDKSCLAGYECRKSTSTTTCPTQVPYPQCAADQYIRTVYDESTKCPVRHECVKYEGRKCPAPPPFAGCAPDEHAVEDRDPNGCAIGFRCQKGERRAACGNNICEEGEADNPGGCGPNADPRCIGPPAQVGTCPQDCRPKQGTCGNNICEPGEDRHCLQDCRTTTGPGKCGDSVCDPGEDANSCPSDCKVPGKTCPLTLNCADGSQVACRQDSDRCRCDQCPVTNLPQGCRQEPDEKGFVTVRCEHRQECREVPQEERIACTEKGGTPVFRKDETGCKRFECSFGAGGGLFTPHEPSCPTGDEVKKGIDKCFELGLRGVVKYERGCPAATCTEKGEEKRHCAEPSGEEREKFDSECRSKGGRLARFVNHDGCPQVTCYEEQSCQRELPEEAYKACGAKGGEIAVKRDHNGCVVFSDCLHRGNIEESYIEESDRRVEPAELLQIALNLERLKVELDKLARETRHIAEYYKGTGSSESERFERVSDMFAAAGEKIDEIKNRIRSDADSMDREDLREIRKDVRYVKDIMIKDILFLMLSNGEEVKKIKQGDSTDCEDDNSCFNEAFRVCKPIKFYPEGDEGPEVTVTGLEDGKCVMKAVLPADKGPPAGVVPGGPPWEMTCRIEKYALGVSNPETDIFPHCQGSMLELIKRFGVPDGGNKGPPGIPGKCSGRECKEYCQRGPEEAKECMQYFGGGRGGGGEDEFREGRDFRGGGEFGDEFERGGRFEGPGFESGRGGFEERRFEPRGPGPGREGTGVRPVSTASPEPAACVGCLNNGVCDPNECVGCADCARR